MPIHTNSTFQSFASIRSTGNSAILELYQREQEAIAKGDDQLEAQLYAQRKAIGQSLAKIADAEWAMLNSPQAVAHIAAGLDNSAAAGRQALTQLRSLKTALKAAGQILGILRKLVEIVT